MERTLRFRLNGSPFEIVDREETVVLDWLRRKQRLTGTKEGCREGDCGACMVLLGERTDQGIQWKTALSCLLALGELDGKHVVTIEGIASGGLTPVMKAMLDEGASQCGFCTPGFVVSLTSYLISGGEITYDGAVRAIEGNLCRCTGYGSIQRAAEHLVSRFKELPTALPERIRELERAGVIPAGIADHMSDLPEPGFPDATDLSANGHERLTLGGGTDHYVRNPDPDAGPQRASISFLDRDPALRRISHTDDAITIGAAVTVQEFFENPIIRETYRGIELHESDFASLPIRNRATLAGNITNASPIGDMTAILLALRAEVRISGSEPESTRMLPLDRYFLAYRRTALEAGESVTALVLPMPQASVRRCFNFEKVAKRTHLDIASVNSACLAAADGEGVIEDISLSAGGVGPVPLRLRETEEFLVGKRVDAGTARGAAEVAAGECSPIDDVRGAAAYRRVLLGRFVWAHLMRLAPEIEPELAKELLP